MNKLYDFRDQYFEEFDIDRAKYKTEDVRKEQQLTLSMLEQTQGEVSIWMG